MFLVGERAACIFVSCSDFHQGNMGLGFGTDLSFWVHCVINSRVVQGSWQGVCFQPAEYIWHFPLTHPSRRIFSPLTSRDLGLERAARLFPFKLQAVFRMSALIYVSLEVIIQTQPELKCGTWMTHLAGEEHFWLKKVMAKERQLVVRYRTCWCDLGFKTISEAETNGKRLELLSSWTWDALGWEAQVRARLPEDTFRLVVGSSTAGPRFGPSLGLAARAWVSFFCSQFAGMFTGRYVRTTNQRF